MIAVMMKDDSFEIHPISQDDLGAILEVYRQCDDRFPIRRQGIGKAVVDAIENEIRKDTQITVILSGVQINNPQAIRFWQRNGYRIVSEPKLYPDQTTAINLRKDIPWAMG